MYVNVLSANRGFFSFCIDATRVLDETFQLKVELQWAGRATIHRDSKHSSGVEAWNTHTQGIQVRVVGEWMSHTSYANWKQVIIA